MIKITQLRKKYGKYQALDGLDMNVEEGALYGFIGPNGAGKTSTIRIMLGLLRPDSGTVEIDNKNIAEISREFKGMIGYVPDYFGVYDNLKVCEYMEFFASCYGMEGLTARKRCDALLAQVELDDKKDYFVDALSRGMKQKLCLARALIHNPEIMIMDEPTSGLDPRTRFEFKEIMKELHDQGKTIIVSSHLLSELSELCTDIGIIDQGKMILGGNIEDILSKVNSSNPLNIGIYGNVKEAVEFLKKDHRIKTIMARDQEISVTFEGNEEEETNLLKSMIENNIHVRSFIREQGSLETVFMQLTNKEIEREVLSYEN